MDTLLILRDTITSHAVKVIDTCQPYVQEAETNWKDVIITAIICTAIVIILCYGIFKLYQWQEGVIKAKETDANNKRNQENEEKNRKWNADLLEKKLQILKELCYAINDGDKQLKAYGDDIKRFFNVINRERGVPYDNDETTSDQHKDQETSSGQQQTDTNPNI